ncbi:hypothetical protein Bbelb_172760 [Branchiostoma belcheri]|nr:hypothetical protein Bbelb_172760 [Branchiostoma belcheri]
MAVIHMNEYVASTCAMELLSHGTCPKHHHDPPGYRVSPAPFFPAPAPFSHVAERQATGEGHGSLVIETLWRETSIFIQPEVPRLCSILTKSTHSHTQTVTITNSKATRSHSTPRLIDAP